MKTFHKKVGMGAASLLLLASAALHAQGVLTVTPGRVLTTTAGTGTLGYTGDHGAATAATLANPAAVAYDSAGNLFVADANNHVLREVLKSNGTIVTVAGTGVAGLAGDNGAATSAQLDTPTGVAVDAAGNLYIADSHNHRVRKVTGGTISTVAGTGVSGFAGDGGPGVAAQLALPTAVAVDASGNLYIADTNNQRVRLLSGGTLTTIAGNGEQGFAGDGGAATAASLDSPTGVAVDATGNVYVADRHNQRVRQISGGTITTLAGSGTPSFGGAFAGDGANAAAALLASPTGVSVDAAGNVFIADTNNQRIRQVSSGAISTVAGDGTQDASRLNAPKAAAVDAAGTLSIADTLNQRIRSTAAPTLNFASTPVGIASASQPITLANSGNASLTVSSMVYAGPFTTVTGGTCSGAPVILAAGASCVQNVAFVPQVVGAATGSVVFSGAGVVPQTVLLNGTATKGSTTTTLTANVAGPFVNQPIIFTATVARVGVGAAPTGTVTFFSNGTTQIGTPQTISATQSTASVQTSLSAAGSYAITAVFSGDANYNGSTGALTEAVGDFTIAPAGSAALDAKAGDTATFNFYVSPVGGPFNLPVAFTATGLPSGATVTFTPTSVTPGGTGAGVSMAIKLPANQVMLHRFGPEAGATLALLLIVLPFSRRSRKTRRRLTRTTLLSLGALGLAASLTGCGGGYLNHGYTITIRGTATSSTGATLQHETTVQLTVHLK